MKQENLEILKRHEHLFTTLRDAQYMKGMNVGEKRDLLKVMQEEFIPKYQVDLWCPNCVATLVKKVYRHYEMWKEKQVAPEPIAEPITVHATFPYQEPEFVQLDLGTELDLVWAAPSIAKPVILPAHLFNAANLLGVDFAAGKVSRAITRKQVVDMCKARKIHMLAAFTVLLDSQSEASKPRLNFSYMPGEHVDVLISDNTLPKKLDIEGLIRSHPDIKFGLLGDQEAIEAPNCVNIKDTSLNGLCCHLMRNRTCLVSSNNIASGLAWAIGVKNIIYGPANGYDSNPEAIHVSNFSQLKKAIDEAR